MSEQATVDVAPDIGPTTDAFFVPAEDGFDARPHARSPWAAHLVHGRLVMGLMARQVALDHLGTDWRPTRLTTDLLRPIPMGTITVTTAVRRAGNRLLVIEATASAGGVEVAWASVQALRTSGATSQVHASPAPFDPPHPDSLESAPIGRSSHLGEVRRVDRPDEPDRRFAWFRDRCPLVDGEDDLPFVRAATAADWVSPFTNFGPDGLAAINADVTLYLSRLPDGPWIGFDTLGHQSDHGIAVSSCALHDTSGRIGIAAAAALPY